MLYAILFDSKGPVLQIPVLKGSSVTGKFYRESVLTQLVDFYQKCRPCTGMRGIKLLEDNTPAYKFAMIQEYLKESGLDVLDHPPYSPDLSPCDFWFPRRKEMLAGHRFESRYVISCVRSTSVCNIHLEMRTLRHSEMGRSV
jgi:histone-lysine N-methyltransferase SETMAR